MSKNVPTPSADAEAMSSERKKEGVRQTKEFITFSYDKLIRQEVSWGRRPLWDTTQHAGAIKLEQESISASRTIGPFCETLFIRIDDEGGGGGIQTSLLMHAKWLMWNPE